MATRQETQNKRRTMRESIIEACRNGQINEGDLMPPVRDLAKQYGLSVNLAIEVIQSLVAEGVLHARPGAGTIAGNPRPASRGTYLFLLPERISRAAVSSIYVGTALRGFEVAVANLGGACLTLELEQASQFARSGQMPPLAGLFSLSPFAVSTLVNDLATNKDLPSVVFGDPQSSFSRSSGVDSLTSPVDSIQFDDVNGGLQATQHLLAAGYDNIAYLAMHANNSSHDYSWSVDRETGWRSAMVQAKKSCDGLAFHPLKNPSTDYKVEYVHGSEQMEAARSAVEPLCAAVQKQQVTAVVAANLYAARTLFTVLKESQLEPKQWPAVVCFDGLDGLDNHVVSALNLPWDEVGKAAAQLLWERNVGRLRGRNTARLVPMQLIPRLTCRPDWTSASLLVEPQLEVMTLPAPPTGLNVNPAPV